MMDDEFYKVILSYTWDTRHYSYPYVPTSIEKRFQEMHTFQVKKKKKVMKINK